MKKKIGLASLIPALALILAGCCHPPVKEISLTQAQLERAQGTGNTVYAPKKYREAQELLKRAKTLAHQKCGEAWKTLKQAQMKIQEAEEEAQKARIQARQKALEAIKKAKKALDEARTAQALRYTPDLYAAAQELLKQAQESFQKGDYLESRSRAQRATTLATTARDAAQKVKELLSREPPEGSSSPMG